MTRISILLAALAALALALPAGAEECVPTTSQPELDVETVFFGRQYVDNDFCQFGPENGASGGSYGGGEGDGSCLFSIWFYTESNDIDGLQRGDEVVDDTCGGMIESDTLTFF